ncbi:MAG: SulP family inorganic anion transporter [Propionibacteriaceae bacterium]
MGVVHAPHADRQRSGWRTVLPGVEVLLHYDRSWLRGDLLAGVTVAAYLVPQVMAYAVIAGIPPVYGLVSCLAPILAYAVFGGSRQLSVGPESTTALMTAAGAGAIVAVVGMERYLDVVAALAIAVGVFCVVGWATRLGFLAELLSRPVLIGYMTGVAVLMMVGQLGRLLRIGVTGSRTDEQLLSVARQLSQVEWPTVVLSLCTLVALVVLGRVAPKWPGPLLVIAAATVVVLLVDASRVGVDLVGAVPATLPAPRLPDLTGLPLPTLAYTAVGIALVGYSDNVLTARAFADKRGEKIRGSQEFLALGVANLGSGLTQGMPVSSSGSRTVLGDSLGSRTQLYSLVSAVCILLTIVLLGPVLALFPRAALAALIVYAALRLIDVAEWRRLARFRKSEAVLASVTALVVVFVGVLPGIGIAVALSVIELLRRLAAPHDSILGYVPGLAGMHDVDDYPAAEQVEGIVVYRYDSPLFFANAENFRRRALAAVDEARGPVRWFLLNAEANVEVDLTAVDALDSLRRALDARGIVFAMARVKQDLRDQLAAAGFLAAVGEERVFATLPTAMNAYVAWFRERTGRDLVLPTAPGTTRPGQDASSTGSESG